MGSYFCTPPNKAAADGTLIDYHVGDGETEATNLSVVVGPQATVVFDLDDSKNDYVQVVGNAVFSLYDYVTISGGFGVEKSSASVTLADGTAVETDLLTIGGSSVDVFAGVNGPATNSEALGVSLTGVDFALALFTPQAGQPAAGLKWTALEVNAQSFALLGVPEITLNASDIAVEINRVSGVAEDVDADTKVIDFAADPLVAATGPGTSVTLDMDSADGQLLRAQVGNATVAISDYVFLRGSLAFEKGGSQTVTLSDGSTKEVSVVKIGAGDVDIFAGVGPYFVDSDGDGDIDDDDTPDADAMGVAVHDVNVGLALMKPTDTNENASYVALKVTAADLDILGLPSELVFDIQGVTFEVNRASDPDDPNAPVVDFTKLIGGGMQIPTGSASEMKLDFTDEFLRVSIAKATVAISDYVYISGGLAFEKGATQTVTLSDSTTKEVSVVKIGAGDVDVFAGVGPYFVDSNNDGVIDENDTPDTDAMGVAVHDIDLGLALMKPTNNSDKASYFAIKVSAETVQILGLPEEIGFDKIKGVTFEINRASDPANENAPVVDFSKLAGGGMEIPTGTGVVMIDHAYQFLRVSVAKVTVSISDYIYLSGGLAFEHVSAQTVTLSDGSTKDVSVIKIGAGNVDVFAGIGPYFVDSNNDGVIDGNDTPDVNAMGFAVHDVNVGLALMKPKAQADQARYFALKVTAADIDILGLPSELVFDIQGITFEVNRASDPSNPNAPVVDFTKLPDKKMSVSTGAGPGVELDYATQFLRVSVAKASLQIDEFVYITGGFAFTKGSRIEVSLTDNSKKQVDYIAIGASNVTVFVGIDGPYLADTNGDKVIDIDPNNAIPDDTPNTEALGLSLVNVGFGLALLKPTSQADNSRYYALKVNADQVALVGVSEIILQANGIFVGVNMARKSGATGDQPAIDFTKLSGGGLSVSTGNAPVLLDFSGTYLGASVANATIQISEFVYLTGSFAFEKGAKLDVVIDTGIPDSMAGTIGFGGQVKGQVEVMTIGGSNITAFVGIDGPYKIDSDGDGVLDQTNEDALGLTLENLNFGFMMMKPTGKLTSLAGQELAIPNDELPKLYALKLSAEHVGLVGLDFLQIDAYEVIVEVNYGSKWLGQFTPNVDFAASFPDNTPVGYALNTGGDPLIFDFESQLIRASAGQVKLIISDFVYLTGSFAFEMGPTYSMDINTEASIGGNGSVIPDVEMRTITVGLSNVYAFVGMGPYFVDSNGDKVIDETDERSSDAIGVVIEDLDVGLMLMSPTLLQSGGNPIRFFSMKMDASLAAFVGLGDDFVMAGHDIEVAANMSFIPAAGLPSPLNVNFKSSFESQAGANDGQFAINTGGDPVTLDFDSFLLKLVVGYAELDIMGYVQLFGSFAFEAGPSQTVTLTDGSQKSVKTMTIGFNDVNAFVGNGPYFVNTNGDNRIDENDIPNSNAIGLVIKDLDGGFMLMASTEASDPGAYFALKASLTYAGIVGIDAITLEVEAVHFEMNLGLGTSGVAVVDFKQSFGNDGYAVNTGNPDEPVYIDYEHMWVRMAGEVHIVVADALYFLGYADLQIDDQSILLFADMEMSIGDDLASRGGSPWLNFSARGLFFMDYASGDLGLNLELSGNAKFGSTLEFNAEFNLYMNNTGKAITYQVPDYFQGGEYGLPYDTLTITAGAPQLDGSHGSAGDYLVVMATGSLLISGDLANLYGAFRLEVTRWNISVQAAGLFTFASLAAVQASGYFEMSDAGVLAVLDLEGDLKLGPAKLSAVFQFEMNTTSRDWKIQRMVYNDVGDLVVEKIDLQAKTTQIFISGSIEISSIILEGAFYLKKTPDALEIAVAARVELGGFGEINAAGALKLTDDCFVASLQLGDIDLGFLTFAGAASLDINTTSRNQTVTRFKFDFETGQVTTQLETGTIAANTISIYVSGVLDISPFELRGSFWLTKTPDLLQVEVDAKLTISPIGEVDAVGYLEASEAGFVTSLWLAGDLSFGPVSIEGDLSLEMNTTNEDRYIQGNRVKALIPADTTRYAIKGTIRIGAEYTFEVDLKAGYGSIDIPIEDISISLGEMGSVTANGDIYIGDGGVKALVRLTGDIKLGPGKFAAFAQIEINTTASAWNIERYQYDFAAGKVKSLPVAYTLPKNTMQVYLHGRLTVFEDYYVEGEFVIKDIDQIFNVIQVQVNYAKLVVFDGSFLELEFTFSGAVNYVRESYGNPGLVINAALGQENYDPSAKLSGSGFFLQVNNRDGDGSDQYDLGIERNSFAVIIEDASLDPGIGLDFNVKGSAAIRYRQGVMSFEAQASVQLFSIAKLDADIFFSSEGEFDIDLSGRIDLSDDGEVDAMTGSPKTGFEAGYDISITAQASGFISYLDNNGRKPFGDQNRKLAFGLSGAFKAHVEVWGEVCVLGACEDDEWEFPEVGMGFYFDYDESTGDVTGSGWAEVKIEGEYFYADIEYHKGDKLSSPETGSIRVAGDSDGSRFSGGELYVFVGERAQYRGFDTAETNETVAVSQGDDDGVRVKLLGKVGYYGNVTKVWVYAGSGVDTILVADTVTLETRVSGGSGDDVITSYGTGTGNYYSGYKGQDTITVGAGSDYEIRGGDQDDAITVIGGSGTVYADGVDSNAGADTLTIQGGNVTIYSGPGADIFNVRGGDSIVYAGTGDDIFNISGGDGEFYGEDGSDDYQLTGGKGIVDGGDDDDSFTSSVDTIFRADGTYTGSYDKFSILIDSTNTQTLDFSGERVWVLATEGPDVIEIGEKAISVQGDIVNLSGGNMSIIDALGGDDTIKLTGGRVNIGAGYGADTITITGGEGNINSDPGNDVITITNVDANINNTQGPHNLSVIGDEGLDTIYFTGNNIAIYGTNVSDTIEVLEGRVDINPDDNGEIVNILSGAVVVDGWRGNDTITRTSGDVPIYGGWDRDTITIEGGSGDAFGGNGNDTFNLLVDVTAYGERGHDIFNLSTATVSVFGDTGDDQFNISGGTISADGGEDNDVFNLTGGTGLLNSGSDDDVFNLSGGTFTINGKAGDDTLNVTGGSADFISGDGNDTASFLNRTGSTGTFSFSGDSDTDTLVFNLDTGGSYVILGNREIAIDGYTVSFTDLVEMIEIADAAVRTKFAPGSGTPSFGSAAVTMAVNKLNSSANMTLGSLALTTTGDASVAGLTSTTGGLNLMVGGAFTASDNLKAATSLDINSATSVIANGTLTAEDGHIDVRVADGNGSATFDKSLKASEWVRLTAATLVVSRSITADSITIQTRDSFVVNDKWTAADYINIRVFGDNANITFNASPVFGTWLQAIAPDGALHIAAGVEFKSPEGYLVLKSRHSSLTAANPLVTQVEKLNLVTAPHGTGAVFITESDDLILTTDSVISNFADLIYEAGVFDAITWIASAASSWLNEVSGDIGNALTVGAGSLHLVLASSVLTLAAGKLSVKDDLTLIATEIDFLSGADTVSGAGNLTIQSNHSDHSYNLGTAAVLGSTPIDDATALDLPARDLDALVDGWTQVSIGHTGAANTMVFGDTTFTEDVDFYAGTIEVRGSLQSVADTLRFTGDHMHIQPYKINVPGSGITTSGITATEIIVDLTETMQIEGWLRATDLLQIDVTATSGDTSLSAELTGELETDAPDSSIVITTTKAIDLKTSVEAKGDGVLISITSGSDLSLLEGGKVVARGANVRIELDAADVLSVTSGTAITAGARFVGETPNLTGENSDIHLSGAGEMWLAGAVTASRNIQLDFGSATGTHGDYFDAIQGITLFQGAPVSEHEQALVGETFPEGLRPEFTLNGVDLAPGAVIVTTLEAGLRWLLTDADGNRYVIFRNDLDDDGATDTLDVQALHPLFGHRQYAFLLTGTLTTLMDGAGLTISVDDPLILRGNIDLQGAGSDLTVQSDELVYFEGQFQIGGSITAYGGVELDGTDLGGASNVAGATFGKSIYLHDTASLITTEAGSSIDLWASQEIALLGAVISGGTLGATGVTWSGPDSTLAVTVGGHFELDSAIMAAKSVTVNAASLVVTTVGGITAGGLTSDPSTCSGQICGGLIDINVLGDLEIMGRLVSGGTLERVGDVDVVNWGTESGMIDISAGGQAFIGGNTVNQNGDPIEVGGVLEALSGVVVSGGTHTSGTSIYVQGGSELIVEDAGGSISLTAAEHADVQGWLIAGGELTGDSLNRQATYFNGDSTISVQAGYQIKLGRSLQAGKQIDLVGGSDPETGVGIVLFGSVQLSTTAQNSQINLNAPGQIRILAPIDGTSYAIHAPGAGSVVNLGSAATANDVIYVAGKVLGHSAINLHGDDAALNLDFSGLLETIDGSITLNLGSSAPLNGSLTAGGATSDIVITTNGTMEIHGSLIAGHDVRVTAGSQLIQGEVSLQTFGTSVIKSISGDGIIQLIGYNDVVLNSQVGPGSLDLELLQLEATHGTLFIQSESGVVETDGRLLIVAGDLDLNGVVTSTASGAQAPHYDVDVRVGGDVDLQNNLTFAGSLALTAGGNIDIYAVKIDVANPGQRVMLDAGGDLTLGRETVAVGHPTLPDGQKYMDGTTVAAGAEVILRAGGALTIYAGVEVLTADDDSQIIVEAPDAHFDLLGGLYAGAALDGNNDRIWTGQNAAISLTAGSLTAGGLGVDDVGSEAYRAGVLRATGDINLDLTNAAADASLSLSIESFIMADPTGSNTFSDPTNSGDVTITAVAPVQIFGLVDALNPDGGVTITTTGQLLVDGVIQAGASVTLTGGTDAATGIGLWVTPLQLQGDGQGGYVLDQFGNPVRLGGGVINTLPSTGSGGGTITLTAADSILIQNVVGEVGAAVAAVTIESTAGDVKLQSRVNADDAIRILAGGNLEIFAGTSVRTRGTAGTVDLLAGGNLLIAAADGAALAAYVESQGAMHLSGDLVHIGGAARVTGAARLLVNAQSDIQVTGLLGSGGDVELNAGVNPAWPESQLLQPIAFTALSPDGDILVTGMGQVVSGGALALQAGGIVFIQAEASMGVGTVTVQRPVIQTQANIITVVTGYREEAIGIIAVPEVKWVETTATRLVGTEKGLVAEYQYIMDVTLTQSGYYNPNAPEGEQYKDYFIEGHDYCNMNWAGCPSGLPSVDWASYGLDQYTYLNYYPSTYKEFHELSIEERAAVLDALGYSIVYDFSYTNAQKMETRSGNIILMDWTPAWVENELVVVQLDIDGWNDKYIRMPDGAQENILQVVSQGEPELTTKTVGSYFNRAKIQYYQIKSEWTADKGYCEDYELLGCVDFDNSPELHELRFKGDSTREFIIGNDTPIGLYRYPDWYNQPNDILSNKELFIPNGWLPSISMPSNFYYDTCIIEDYGWYRDKCGDKADTDGGPWRGGDIHVGLNNDSNDNDRRANIYWSTGNHTMCCKKPLYAGRTNVIDNSSGDYKY